MTQDISSSQSQDADGLAIYRGLEPGWYRPSSDSAVARYWDGTTLHDELLPASTNGASDHAPATNLLFGETSAAAQEEFVPLHAAPDGLASWAKNLLGHDDGAGLHRPRRQGALTRLLIGLGAVLVVVAVIDEIGGDTNDMALGTAIIGLCFIVAVAAEVALSASRVGSRSDSVRSPQRPGWQPRTPPGRGSSPYPPGRGRR